MFFPKNQHKAGKAHATAAVLLCKIRRGSGKAQTTLEFTLCFIILIVIFIAAFLVFKWAGETFARRQIGFDTSRRKARAQINFYETPDMNLHVDVPR